MDSDAVSRARHARRYTWDREFQIKGLAHDLASFENLTDTIHDIAAEDDKVFIRFTRSGIFTARY